MRFRDRYPLTCHIIGSLVLMFVLCVVLTAAIYAVFNYAGSPYTQPLLSTVYSQAALIYLVIVLLAYFDR